MAIVLACYSHRITDFGDYDIYRRHPILYYCNASEEEVASLFKSEGNFYLYNPFDKDLFEIALSLKYTKPI